MVTILIISIPVTALVMGFFTLKGVQLGLRWQQEMKEARPPTMQSPIAPIVEHVQQKQEQKAAIEQYTVYDEWVNGAKEG